MLNADEVRTYIHKLWRAEPEVLDQLYGVFKSQQSKLVRVCDPDMFFLSVLAVPPSRFRPASVMGYALNIVLHIILWYLKYVYHTYQLGNSTTIIVG